MGKGNVLGNDPFERGAATREAVVEPAVPAPAPAVETKEPFETKKPLRKRAKRPSVKRPAVHKAKLHVLPAAETPRPTKRNEERIADNPPSTPGVETSLSTPSALSEFALKMAGRALAVPAVQRAVQTLGSSPAFGRLLSTAARATGYVFRSPLAGAARALLPAARDAAAAAMAPDAASSVVTTALSAAETARRILTATPSPSDVDAFGEDPAIVERMIPVLDFFYERYWRVQVEGVENIPKGPCIIVCNHSGALPYDGPIMRTVLRREAHRPEARWLVEDAMAHAPFMGVYLNRLGAVRACPENAELLLDRGVPLIVFPEGVHGMSKVTIGWAGGEHYRVGRFGRGGFVKIALRKRVPIIPIAVVGAEEALPLLARIPAGSLGIPYIPITPSLFMPLPSQWSVRVLPPIDTSAVATGAEPEQALVQQITEDVRQAIQVSLNQMVAGRKKR